MKLEIQGCEPFGVLHGSLHFGKDLFQLGQMLLVSQSSRSCGAYALEGDAHFHQVLDVMLLGDDAPLDDLAKELPSVERNRGALPDPGSQNPNNAEASERLSQGGPSRSEVLAELSFGRQLLSRLEVSTGDERHDLVNDIVADRGLLDRPNLRLKRFLTRYLGLLWHVLLYECVGFSSQKIHERLSSSPRYLSFD